MPVSSFDEISNTTSDQHIAEKEKRSAALSSVTAAIFLTGMKLVVGLLTNSLGILSEAAHSALDLVAAAITYAAVKISDRPPDSNHTYGHGKVENLSALIETLLLFIRVFGLSMKHSNACSSNPSMWKLRFGVLS